MLFNIHVITGWLMPDNEAHKQVLYNQLEKKLMEDYSSLNMEEVEYAFRQNGTGIEDWGKVFNLNMLDKVLQPYLQKRAQVREFTDKQRHHELSALPPSPTDWKELCELYYQRYLSGTYNLLLWPEQLYDEFVNCQMMDKDVFRDFMDKAERALFLKYQEEIVEANMRGDKRSVAAMQNKIADLAGDDNYLVIALAKKLSVKYLYSEAKQKGIKNLFIQDK